ncbi:hypothetical protein HMI54_004786, partial [Coelomomyces lativittatus]
LPFLPLRGYPSLVTFTPQLSLINPLSRGRTTSSIKHVPLTHLLDHISSIPIFIMLTTAIFSLISSLPTTLWRHWLSSSTPWSFFLITFPLYIPFFGSH